MCVSLVNVSILESVTSIGSAAFWGDTSIVELIIPSSVTTIGDSAFFRCYNLKNITLSNNLVSISSSLFYGCTGLMYITIPLSVKNIEKNSFFGCNRDLIVNMSSHTIFDEEAFHGITPIILYFDSSIDHIRDNISTIIDTISVNNVDSIGTNSNDNNDIVISNNNKMTKDCINKHKDGCCSGRIEISNLMNSIDTNAFAGLIISYYFNLLIFKFIYFCIFRLY